MSRAIPLALALALTAAAPAAAHPGHGPTEVDIANYAYSPQTVNIATGDTVIWFWTGLDTNHSITNTGADPFDSDPGRNPTSADHHTGEAYSHVFNSAGTFHYFCKVHPFMTGTVVVADLGTGSAPPTPDTIPPDVSSTTARLSGRKLKLGFVLTEPADMRADIKLGRKLVKSVDFSGVIGTNNASVSARTLKPGSYTVALVATDKAGNSSRASTARFKVKKKKKKR
jgi:plastocyanin